MKRMLVRMIDNKGKIGPEYLIIKTDRMLLQEKIIKIIALILSLIGIASILSYIF